jgi:phosphoribosylglycinamide formyltransferase-1
LAQVAVAIAPDDDESTLHERIKSVERTLYPDVLTKVLAVLDRGGEPTDIHVTP